MTSAGGGGIFTQRNIAESKVVMAFLVLPDEGSQRKEWHTNSVNAIFNDEEWTETGF